MDKNFKLINLLFFFGILLYFKFPIHITETFKIVQVQSKLNNDYYNVRNDYQNIGEAADLLSQIRHRIHKLINNLNINNSQNSQIAKLIKNLNDRFDYQNIYEAKKEENSTSFTINKGKEIHICLRDRKNNNKLHDINTLMYVVIHELAHIGSDSVGHNEEFYTNFIYLLRVAINIGVYQKINYQLYPTNYCGLVINESPFY